MMGLPLATRTIGALRRSGRYATGLLFAHTRVLLPALLRLQAVAHRYCLRQPFASLAPRGLYLNSLKNYIIHVKPRLYYI